MKPTHGEQLPLSGYAILTVYSTHMAMEAKDPAENVDDHDALQFGWDWRWVEDRVFEVRITVAIEPSEARHQFATANVIGRFRQFSDSPAATIDQFVRLQAVAILMPYARQYLSTLTANSLHGAYYLPTINVEALMNGYDKSGTTAARQLAELESDKKSVAPKTSRALKDTHKKK